MMRSSIARPPSWSMATRTTDQVVVRSAMVRLKLDACPLFVQQSLVNTDYRRFVSTDQRRGGLVCAVAPTTTQKVFNLFLYLESSDKVFLCVNI